MAELGHLQLQSQDIQLQAILHLLQDGQLLQHLQDSAHLFQLIHLLLVMQFLCLLMEYQHLHILLLHTLPLLILPLHIKLHLTLPCQLLFTLPLQWQLQVGGMQLHLQEHLQCLLFLLNPHMVMEDLAMDMVIMLIMDPKNAPKQERLMAILTILMIILIV